MRIWSNLIAARFAVDRHLFYVSFNTELSVAHLLVESLFLNPAP